MVEERGKKKSKRVGRNRRKCWSEWGFKMWASVNGFHLTLQYLRSPLESSRHLSHALVWRRNMRTKRSKARVMRTHLEPNFGSVQWESDQVSNACSGSSTDKLHSCGGRYISRAKTNHFSAPSGQWGFKCDVWIGWCEHKIGELKPRGRHVLDNIIGLTPLLQNKVVINTFWQIKVQTFFPPKLIFSISNLIRPSVTTDIHKLLNLLRNQEALITREHLVPWRVYMRRGEGSLHVNHARKHVWEAHPILTEAASQPHW